MRCDVIDDLDDKRLSSRWDASFQFFEPSSEISADHINGQSKASRMISLPGRDPTVVHSSRLARQT
jgi:hypothetical protein